MAVDNPVKVIRYGRHEFTTHEAEANGAVTAGDIVVEENGGATVARATAATSETQYFIAVDDRERGMELQDDYADGEQVKYVAASGGALNLLLADGETMDPTSETRLTLSATAGKVKVIDTGGGETDTDVLAIADTESTVAASGAAEPVPTKVV